VCTRCNSVAPLPEGYLMPPKFRPNEPDAAKRAMSCYVLLPDGTCVSALSTLFSSHCTANSDAIPANRRSSFARRSVSGALLS